MTPTHPLYELVAKSLLAVIGFVVVVGGLLGVLAWIMAKSPRLKGSKAIADFINMMLG